MEFLSVGGIKLKVVLDPLECEEYGISRLDGGVLGEGERESVRRILERARAEASFFTAGERLLIQLYPLGERGAELFVTKLSAIPERERRTVTESGILTYLDRRTHFRFSDRQSLLGAVGLLRDRPIDLYLAVDGSYYLTLDESFFGEASDCEALTEFADRVHRLPLGISNEWGSQLLNRRPLATLL